MERGKSNIVDVIAANIRVGENFNGKIVYGLKTIGCNIQHITAFWQAKVGPAIRTCNKGFIRLLHIDLCVADGCIVFLVENINGYLPGEIGESKGKVGLSTMVKHYFSRENEIVVFQSKSQVHFRESNL